MKSDSVDLLTGTTQKNPLLVILPQMIMVVLTAWVFVPWSLRISLDDRILTIACFVNSIIWWLALYWTLHHLCFRLAALLSRSADVSDSQPDPAPVASFAILYTTCDDFQPAAAVSCLTQDYPAELTRTVICDDSSEPECLRQIDEFSQRFPKVLVLRRGERTGYKAGNLNHGIRHADLTAEWILILDADQKLPQTYLRQFAAFLRKVPDQVAYVQARQVSDHNQFGQYSTRFQQALGADIDLFYAQDMLLRTQYGFLPLIGHGAAIRLSALKQVPFPEVVSEDFALSLEFRNHNLSGIYAPQVLSSESFPRSFPAFFVRFRKFAGGTAELLRRHLYRFLKGPAAFTEKLDFCMMVGWYFLIPLIVINGYLSCWVCHRLWSFRIAALHPVLPLMFAFLFMVNIPLIYSGTPTVWHAIQHWAWSTAVYSATLPGAALRFLRYFLFGGRPRFDRTPKDNHEPPPEIAVTCGMMLLGTATVGFAAWMYSPFSSVLYGLGSAYLLFPLYPCLHQSSLLGLISRLAVWIPGMFYILALWDMWKWQGL